MGLPEPGLRTPAKLPSELYSTTVWKSRATTDAPFGLAPGWGSWAGMNVAHSLPLIPVRHAKIFHGCRALVSCTAKFDRRTTISDFFLYMLVSSTAMVPTSARKQL